MVIWGMVSYCLNHITDFTYKNQGQAKKDSFLDIKRRFLLLKIEVLALGEDIFGPVFDQKSSPPSTLTDWSQPPGARVLTHSFF